MSGRVGGRIIAISRFFIFFLLTALTAIDPRRIAPTRSARPITLFCPRLTTSPGLIRLTTSHRRIAQPARPHLAITPLPPIPNNITTAPRPMPNPPNNKNRRHPDDGRGGSSSPKHMHTMQSMPRPADNRQPRIQRILHLRPRILDRRNGYRRLIAADLTWWIYVFSHTHSEKCLSKRVFSFFRPSLKCHFTVPMLISSCSAISLMIYPST